MKRVHIIYFSAMGTTKKIAEAIAKGLGANETAYHSLMQASTEHVVIGKEEVAVIAVPVYSGRVPAVAAERLQRFKSEGARAVIAVAYGNRAVEDALIELNDIATHNGFVVVSAGEFIGEHSIFPKVATSRPNTVDLTLAEELGRKSVTITIPLATIPGNQPYRAIDNIPLAPKTVKSKCVKAVKKDKDLCGICAEKCPVKAIGTPKPSTNSKLCIKCGHCIAVCPYDARAYSGPLYWLAGRIFVKQNLQPKESKLYW